MPIPVTTEARMQTRTRSPFTVHYLALLFLSLHWACVLYINSSYLETFVDTRTISTLYVLGALITIAAFLNASTILTRFGNTRTALTFGLLEGVSLLGMAFSPEPLIVMILFVIHQAIVPILLFNLDVFMETSIGNHEETTGRQRGVFLTIMSFTAAVAPLVVGKLLGDGEPNFTSAYLVSALLLVPFLYIITYHFHSFTDPHYPLLNIREGVARFWHTIDVRNVFFAHFLLQFFFTWMVIYTPLYLSSVVGLNWEEIGNILFVALMAYVLLEYLVGYIADTFIGEKEMMAFGFLVTAIATSWFVFLDTTSIGLWMTAMFMTRVGASFIETTTESYFFKHTEGKDTNVIGLFRITRPLSYVAGAMVGGLTLHTLPFNLLFGVLALLMIPGLFFAMALKDTK